MDRVCNTRIFFQFPKFQGINQWAIFTKINQGTYSAIKRVQYACNQLALLMIINLHFILLSSTFAPLIRSVKNS